MEAANQVLYYACIKGISTSTQAHRKEKHKEKEKEHVQEIKPPHPVVMELLADLDMERWYNYVVKLASINRYHRFLHPSRSLLNLHIPR